MMGKTDNDRIFILEIEELLKQGNIGELETLIETKKLKEILTKEEKAQIFMSTCYGYGKECDEVTLLNLMDLIATHLVKGEEMFYVLNCLDRVFGETPLTMVVGNKNFRLANYIFGLGVVDVLKENSAHESILMIDERGVKENCPEIYEVFIKERRQQIEVFCEKRDDGDLKKSEEETKKEIENQDDRRRRALEEFRNLQKAKSAYCGKLDKKEEDISLLLDIFLMQFKEQYSQFKNTDTRKLKLFFNLNTAEKIKGEILDYITDRYKKGIKLTETQKSEVVTCIAKILKHDPIDTDTKQLPKELSDILVRMQQLQQKGIEERKSMERKMYSLSIGPFIGYI